MDSPYDIVLSESSERIIEKVDLTHLLPYLKKKKLVTTEEYEQLTSCRDRGTNSLEVNTQFYYILENKIKTNGQKAFLLFLEALDEEKQHLDHNVLRDELIQVEKQIATRSTSARRNEIDSGFGSATSKVLSFTFPPVMNTSNYEVTNTYEKSGIRYSPVTPLRRRTSLESCVSSDSSQSSAQTVMPTQDYISSLLDKHLELVMTTISDQFSKFKQEIGNKIQNLEKKVETQSIVLCGSSWTSRMSRASLSSHSSGRNSSVCDKSYDNLDNSLVLTRKPLHERASLTKAKNWVSKHHNNDGIISHNRGHEKPKKVASALPAIKSTNTSLQQSTDNAGSSHIGAIRTLPPLIEPKVIAMTWIKTVYCTTRCNTVHRVMASAGQYTLPPITRSIL